MHGASSKAWNMRVHIAGMGTASIGRLSLILIEFRKAEWAGSDVQEQYKDSDGLHWGFIQIYICIWFDNAWLASIQEPEIDLFLLLFYSMSRILANTMHVFLGKSVAFLQSSSKRGPFYSSVF